MKIGILTSSRADFGIYLPLLQALKADSFFELEIIAFGTHLSRYHGHTIDDIIAQGLEVKHQISSLLINDDPEAIASSYALTAIKFGDFWNQFGAAYDWVFCLGDRFEMAAAVAAGIPYNIPFAHIHGGETTLGAIDNIYRHSITLASRLHFVATESFANRVRQLNGQDARCIVTGSLSLENIKNMQLLEIEAFESKWGIDLSLPSILVTIHPETVAFEKNQEYADEVYRALIKISEDFQVIITMPNADTLGTVYREMYTKLKFAAPSMVHLIESFGTQSYFTCIKHAALVIGNSSSGIIEVASFGKYAINLGDRQKGRLASENVIHIPFQSVSITDVFNKFSNKEYTGKNIYFKNDVVQLFIQTLKKQQIEYLS